VNNLYFVSIRFIKGAVVLKGGLISKKLDMLLLINYFLFSLIGWYVGGILVAIAGILIAYLLDIFTPKWKHELTWKDLDTALVNIYKYGKSPCELCIRADNRRIFVYRDERDDSRRGGPPKSRIRMAVCMPLVDWSDLFTEDTYSQLLRKYGGKGMYSKNRGPKSYDIFMKKGHELEDCKEILKFLFEKSVGGLRPDIYARSVVNAKKNIWIDHSEETKEANRHKLKAKH
jgi:hypothetical protein